MSLRTRKITTTKNHTIIYKTNSKKEDYVPSELVIANAIPSFDIGITGSAPANYSKYVNGFFFACLMLRAESISDAKPVLLNPEGQVVEKGMEGYWYIENFGGSHGRCNTKELLIEWSLSIDTYGDVFWYDIYDTKGNWKGFETVHGYRVSIVIDERGKIIGYLVDYGDSSGNYFSRKVDPKKFDVIEDGQILRYKNPKSNKAEAFDLKPEYVLSFRHPDLSNPYRGYSYVDAGKYYIEGLDLIDRTRLAILRRGSIIPFIIKQVHVGVKAQDDKHKDDFVSALNSGADEAGDILFVPPMYDVINFPMTHRDLMYIEVASTYQKNIAHLLKIPPALMGLEGDTGRANLESARSQFYIQFVLPAIHKLEDTITHIHLSRVGLEGYTFQLKVNVPRDVQIELKKNIQLKQEGIITTNEVRTIYDYPNIGAKGDKLIGTSQMITMDDVIEGVQPNETKIRNGLGDGTGNAESTIGNPKEPRAKRTTRSPKDI